MNVVKIGNADLRGNLDSSVGNEGDEGLLWRLHFWVFCLKKGIASIECSEQFSALC